MAPLRRARGGEGPYPINSFKNEQGQGHMVAIETRGHLHFVLVFNTGYVTFADYGLQRLSKCVFPVQGDKCKCSELN